MSRLAFCALALMLSLSSGIAVAAAADGEAAIRQIVADQVVAWDAGDGVAYGKRFAPDGAFTNLFGMVMYGAPAFQKRHADILSSFYKGTTKKHTIRRIRFLGSSPG